MNERNTSEGKLNIFISWSGDKSKRIAEELKRALEEDVFPSEGIECFVSTQDIKSGEYWYKKIKSELQTSKLGIMCITKENGKAPWLYFEAGALVGNNLKVIPLLVDCDLNSIGGLPIQANQSIQFNVQDQFLKMLEDIQTQFSLFKDTGLSKDEIHRRYETAYETIKTGLQPELDKLAEEDFFSPDDIYPQDQTTTKRGTVYISAQMSSLNVKDYERQQEFLNDYSKRLKANKILKIKEVSCPAMGVKYNSWEGTTTAVKETFGNLRKARRMIIIYSKEVPTSVLMEIGYGIALGKKIVVFHKKKAKLPFMLRKTAEDIPHLSTREYSDYSDIINSIDTDVNLYLFGDEKHDE